MATYAKTKIKIPQIVRWRMAGVSDNKIAEYLQMSPIGVAQIVKGQEYREEEAAYLNGHLSKMDEALAGNIGAIKKDFKIAVPAAMRALVDAVTQRKDLRASLEAAKEILDRDPDQTLAKGKDANTGIELPDEVLNQAVGVGNSVAASYTKDLKVN